jgi:hypothetical protein
MINDTRSRHFVSLSHPPRLTLTLRLGFFLPRLRPVLLSGSCRLSGDNALLTLSFRCKGANVSLRWQFCGLTLNTLRIAVAIFPALTAVLAIKPRPRAKKVFRD